MRRCDRRCDRRCVCRCGRRCSRKWASLRGRFLSRRRGGHARHSVIHGGAARPRRGDVRRWPRGSRVAGEPPSRCQPEPAAEGDSTRLGGTVSRAWVPSPSPLSPLFFLIFNFGSERRTRSCPSRQVPPARSGGVKGPHVPHRCTQGVGSLERGPRCGPSWLRGTRLTALPMPSPSLADTDGGGAEDRQPPTGTRDSGPGPRRSSCGVHSADSPPWSPLRPSLCAVWEGQVVTVTPARLRWALRRPRGARPRPQPLAWRVKVLCVCVWGGAVELSFVHEAPHHEACAPP